MYMFLNLLLYLTAISLAFQQIPLSHNHGKRVAVIGAGAAGTSFAYHLRNYSHHENVPIDITIYERQSHIGGRSTTINVYDEPFNPVELGASIFVQVNHILQHAVQTLNLSTDGSLSGTYTLRDDPDSLLAVWNGFSFVLKQSQVPSSNPLEDYWRKARLLWRYGLAPLRIQNLVKEVVGKFLNFYEEPYFPFTSVTDVVSSVNLTSVSSIDGWRFLQQKRLATDFAWDIVQAANRVNYASDLSEIHGVETMVSMATEGAVSVDGGNWQMFSGMANLSGANVQLHTEVRRISRNEKGRAFSIKVDEAAGEDLDSYDAIVLAAPFHQTGIEFDDAILDFTPTDDPYRELFVTLFTTPLSLSRKYFNLGLLDEVPTTILTTEPACMRDDEPICDKDQPYPAFFSISTLRAVVNPMTGRRERLYKIFSPAPLSEAFLAQLFGLEQQTDGQLSKDDITWMYRKRWLSYPIEYPRETFEPTRLDADVGDGIWYTAAMEGFISTMETNALMGKNVAKLLVNNWTGNADKNAPGIKEEEKEPVVTDEL